MKIKIGSRKSTLAQIQARDIQSRLSQLGFDSELVFTETIGDQLLKNPIWQLKGKDFFTKELDHALENHQIDLVVHSLKDLSMTRPKGFELAAITERQFPEDILLFNKRRLKQLQKYPETFSQIYIGTSSPRRICTLQKLRSLLPNLQQNPQIQILPRWIRGNVQTRINQINKNYCDGAILAFAGLERMTSDNKSNTLMRDITQNLEYMILPLGQFATAPGQGALAIEIHQNNPNYSLLKELLVKINHDETSRLVTHDRKVFSNYGGGCHLPLGVTSIQHPSGINLTFKEGKINNKVISDKNIHQKNKLESIDMINPKEIFLGIPLKKASHYIHDELLVKKSIFINSKTDTPEKNIPVFFTSRHTYHALADWFKSSQETNHTPIFAAGFKSMSFLANNNIWCHGCADSLGESNLKKYKKSSFLNLFHSLDRQWSVLTNDLSLSKLGRTIPSYTRDIQKTSKEFEKKLARVKYFYWTSFYQFQTYQKHFPKIINHPEKIHLCGLGKTFEQFQQNSYYPTPIFSINNFLSRNKNEL